MKATSVKSVRCAIYTRVSTEHGLDQEFNSLDAQYEAASAYIKSQAHAGWTLIRSRYDDGGYSGADHYAVFTTFADFDRAVECFRGSVAQITATLARSCGSNGLSACADTTLVLDSDQNGRTL